MKKRGLIVTMIFCMALILSSCAMINDILNPIPEEYTEGIKVPKDYPDKVLEIYDDAIVFEAEDDDDEITIKYGTEDDIDDVIDFYEDLFEDEDDLVLEDSDDSKDEYSAEGYGDEFEFEINAEEAQKGYEAEVFKTVVEVKIEFNKSVSKPDETDRPAPPETDAPGTTTLNRAQGFWLCCGVDGDIGDVYRMEGIACNFGNMVMDAYTLFEPEFINNTFTLADEDTFQYVDDGEVVDMHVSFEKIDGVEYLVIMFDDEPEKYYFEKSEYLTMLMYDDMGGEEGTTVKLEDELTDAELEYYITDLNWIVMYYQRPDGTINYDIESNWMYMYSSDKTGYDITSGVYEECTWSIENGYLTFNYTDESITWRIDYESDGINPLLYVYMSGEYEGGIFIFETSLEEPEINNTDIDLEQSIIEKQWEYQYYVYADGTSEYPESGTFFTRYFNSAYTGVYKDNEGTESFEWYLTEDEISFVYSFGTYTYPIAYENIGGEEYFYLMDTEEGYEGGKWIYKANSSYHLLGRSLTDEMWQKKLVGSVWQTSHKVLDDGSSDYDVPYRTLKYNADGSVKYTYKVDGEIVETTIHYHIKNSVLTYIMEDGTEYHYVLRYTNNGTEETHYLYKFDTEIDYTYVYYRDVE